MRGNFARFEPPPSSGRGNFNAAGSWIDPKSLPGLWTPLNRGRGGSGFVTIQSRRCGLERRERQARDKAVSDAKKIQKTAPEHRWGGRTIAPHRPRPLFIPADERLFETAAEFCAALEKYAECATQIKRVNHFSLIVSAFNGRQAVVSSASAMPWPPPMHKVAIRRGAEWIRRVVRTAPVAPIGWPWAMAPPSILTMSGESPSSRVTARPR
jgi:hypothetical protein